MKMPKNKKTYLTLTVCIVLVAMVFLAWPQKKVSSDIAPSKQADKVNAQSLSQANQPTFNKNEYSTDLASSLWTVVNKGRVLPSSYVPAGLIVPNVPLRTSRADPEMQVRSDMASALESMFAAAKTDGINLMLSSGYRSYPEQVSLYNNYASHYGINQADTFSARPGHSEHQTGLAADIEPASRTCEVSQCFETTPEGKWLAANCYKFGFVIRYQRSTQNLTGYEYEPWHVRYVGPALAQLLQSSGLTLEQFFGLPMITEYPASSYALKV